MSRNDEWIVDILQRGEPARAAVLGLKPHDGSPWFRCVMDMLRAHARNEGDVIEGLREILLQVSLEKSQAMKARAHAAMLTPFTIPYHPRAQEIPGRVTESDVGRPDD